MPAPLLAAPVLALLVALGLGALGRWIFGPPKRRTPGNRPDYGLLVPATRALPHDEAARVHAVLAEHHIRATLAPAGKGYDATGRPWPQDATYLLVFPDDADRARELTSC